MNMRMAVPCASGTNMVMAVRAVTLAIMGLAATGAMGVNIVRLVVASRAMRMAMIMSVIVVVGLPTATATAVGVNMVRLVVTSRAMRKLVIVSVMIVAGAAAAAGPVSMSMYMLMSLAIGVLLSMIAGAVVRDANGVSMVMADRDRSRVT
jgi:hypothetical protein